MVAPPEGGRLPGHVAVVTGAGSGIGEAIVRRFVAEGALCVAADVRTDACRELADAYGGRVRATRCDVTVEDDVAAAIDLAVTTFGRLDGVVNNAGIIGAVGPIATTSREQWNATLAVLLDGVFLGVKHAARVMVPRGEGSIINVASVAGVVGGLGPHAYTAAKHGVVGLTRSAASELGAHGVRVNCIAPGSVVSPMTAEAGSGDPADIDGAHARIAEGSLIAGRAGTPEDIAAAAVYLASPDAGYVTGHCLSVDAGRASVAAPYRFADRDGQFLDGGRDRGA
jgi:xanthoxin dehydrogenase